MRPIRDNRYLYQLWKKYEGRGFRRYPLFVLNSALFLVKNGRESWKYIRAIECAGCITGLDESRYPDIRMYVPDFKTDLVQKLIVRNHEFFEDTELNMLKEHFAWKEPVICDCGAYIGNHTLFFVRLLNAKRVYVFEPVSEFFEILNKNMELNGINDSVKLYPYALGSSDGNAKVSSYSRKNKGATSIKESVCGIIRIVRLDDVISKEEKIDLLKIDVEGFEEELLKGAKRVCTEGAPVIFIEIFPENCESVFNLLDEYGYQLNMYIGNNNYVFIKKNI